LHYSDNIDIQPDPEVEPKVERAVGGDSEAFGYLYDIYADRIYRHIYYRTSNMEDARDMTQEVFIKAWQALPKYKRTRTPFLGWLFTISHNRIIDYYRTKKDHAYLNEEVIMEDNEKGPERLVEMQFDQQKIRKAILLLPKDQQQVILLSFIEGLKIAIVYAASIFDK
jgi:RNA polymerase sigma-70 factor (ECF subfamily)